MKCLKNITTGNIIRVDDKQAHQLSGNTWKYVSKNEWKNKNKKPVEESLEETTTNIKLNEKKKKPTKKVK